MLRKYSYDLVLNVSAESYLNPGPFNIKITSTQLQHKIAKGFVVGQNITMG